MKIYHDDVEELVVVDLGESALDGGGWGLRKSVEALDDPELSTDIPNFMACFGQLVRNTKGLLEKLYGMPYEQILKYADEGKLPSLEVEVGQDKFLK